MKRNVLSVLLGLVMLLTLCVGASAATTLPSGYTAVDCVRSVGEGAIDTEYATADATTSYSYEIKFAYESATITGANQTMLGVSAGTARSGLLIARTSGNGGGTAIIFGTDQATSSYSPVTYTNTANETTIRVDIDIAANTYDITKDGQALATDKAINGSPKSASTVFAFANHSSSTSQNFNTPATGSIYYLKMWQDGTLVRDFVPAKNSSGVYGLYDLVKGKFHTDVKNSANILGPKQIVWGAYDIYFTAPSDMTLTIGKGFSDSGEVMPRYASTTEDGVTTHHYKLDAGNYRFMTSGEEYYRLHKNFVVTAAKNGTTINANPGKQTGKGWEQANDCPWPIYQFADEVINSDAYKLKDSVYTKYPDAFSGPTFTNTSKTAYEFTSDPEILAFTEALEEDCANMYHWYLGAPDTDNNDILAVVFTTTDLSSAKNIDEAAALVTANGKPTLHLQAQVHGSEQSATEGALGIMKTLAGEYGEEALEKINVVVMPRINTKGSKDYTYGPKDGGPSGSGVDINLDYYKMQDSLGRTQAIVNVYNQFQPEVVIDLHECRYSYGSTSGRQGDLKMATLENLNIPQQIHDLQSIYFAEIFDLAGENGIYGDYYREDPPNNKPVSGRGNYFTRGCVSILLEIPGQRSGKMFWDRRIFAQYIGVRAILDYTVENAAAVQEAVASAREDIIEAGTYFDPENNLITLYHVEGDKTQTYPMPTVDFVTGEYKDPNATRSVDKYNKAALTRPRPLAYVVSKDSANIETVLQICDWQNVKYEEIGPDRVLELKQYGGTAWKNNSSSTGESGTTLGEAKLMSFPNGAYLFPMNQVSGVVLSLLMEPDVIDTRDDSSPCSFSQQGVLTNAEIYRCEDLSTHELTYVPAAAADCDTDGCTEHWICECGKGFAANEHTNALEDNSWVLPKTGHNFESVSGAYTYICTNSSCGLTMNSVVDALDACDGVGGKVTAGMGVSSEVVIVPAGVTLDMNGERLSPKNLTVNEGGKIVNGTLSIRSDATVNLGSNGGYVPVYTGKMGTMKNYEFYPIETKVGQKYTMVDGGVKYAFGYKYGDYAAYAASVGANAEGLKFGVALDLDTASADYSFSPDSVAKMTEVTDAADSFYRVNLTIIGEDAEDVTVTPYVKFADLGFRYEGESFTMPKTPVAEYAGVTYTRLEDAIAEAEKVGSFAEVYLIDDITYHTPTTIKLAATTRLRVKDDADITISGPVTLDGQNKDAVCVLFRVSDQSKLTLDGVSIKNYKNIWTESGTSNQYGSVGRIEDESTFVMKNCTIENCSGPMRGAFYITGTSTVNIEDCAFVNNKASTQYGGALAIYSTSGVTVKNTIFTNNSSVGSDPEYNLGGAIHLRSGALTLDGCSFSGNTALLGGDVSVTNGSLTLKGTTRMGELYLNTGKSIALGDSFALAEGAAPIVIDGAPNTTVLTGSIVSTAYTSFAALDEGYVINEAGKIVAEGGSEEPPVTPPGDEQTTGFSVNGTAYTTLEDAVAAATSAAASAPVTVTLYEDGSITGERTVGGANKITFKLADNATKDVKITFSTAAAKFITGGNLEFIGGGTNESAPKLILDGGGNSIDHTGTQMLEAKGYEMALKNGVVVQNYYSTNNYSAPFRVRLEGTVTMDGVTVQNNSAKSGAMYAGNHGNINITNSKILNNITTGTGGGAIYLAYNTSDITVTNTTFSGNTSGTSTTNGVALTVQTGGTNTTTGRTTSCTVSGCTFTGNVCNKAAGVVSLYKSGTVVTMTDCTFADNSGNAFSIVSGASLTHSGVTVNGSAYTG